MEGHAEAAGRDAGATATTEHSERAVAGAEPAGRDAAEADQLPLHVHGEPAKIRPTTAVPATTDSTQTTVAAARMMSDRELSRREKASVAAIRNKLLETETVCEEEAQGSGWFRPAQDDFAIVRFVRARDGDVEAAYDQLVETIRWRNKCKPSLVTPEQLPKLLASGIFSPLGLTKEGWPAYALDMSKFKPREIDQEEFARYVGWALEQTVSDRKARTGDKDTKAVWVFDLSGFGVTIHATPYAVSLIKTFISIMETHYPKLGKKVWLIRAPMLFSGLWNVLSTFMSEDTRSGTEFASAERLREEFEDDSLLPASLGGCRGESPAPFRSVATTFYVCQ